ncbi:Rv3654c family TadE-like protein [Nocardia inohanensis]|uniref:Rv3654c family TadE-like protein n=1 Tax=Nocardia inohanensis TaxID=209246 RepID=UPI001FDF136D|nr:Rv3654c family TadE-like protein [Nocardia inohanensis]
MTITTCLALLAMLAMTVLMVQIGVAVAAKHRIQAAADLGALAAAGGLDAGRTSACAQAAVVVRRMGGRVVECEAADWDVTVTAEARVSLGPLGARVVHGTARAGPVAEWE